RIEEFASGFGSTRFMTVDPAGTLLVSTPDQSRVVALPDRNHNGRADAAVMVADGLELPHGLAFRGGDLYIAETGRVKRFRYDPATLRASDPAVVVPNLPPRGNHWTRTSAERCRRMTLPTIEIQAHSAPLGLAFYTGAQFPPSYRGSLFVAYHGSWNRTVPTGYKIVRVPFRDGRPSGPVEDFATGWLQG